MRYDWASLSLAGVAMIALGGCGSQSTPGDTTKAVAGPDPIEQKIAALPPALQRTTFFRAIHDAGYTCQTIVSSTAKQRFDDHAVWAVACDDGGRYVLTLQPGGIFDVSGVPQPKRGL